MPSQRQLQWAQLRVGLTVLFATIVLAVLVFLMTGSTGLFTRKITLRAYFDNAQGLRVGAPVRLQNVDIGNVVSLRIVPERQKSPVEVTMKVTTKYQEFLRKDSAATLATLGVLGETIVDIDSTKAKGEIVSDNTELPVADAPDIQDVVRSSQTTLQNLDTILRRADRIIAFVESGEGTIGRFIKDPALFDSVTRTAVEFEGIVKAMNNGRGTIGKLLADDQLYTRIDTTVTRLNTIIDQVDAGQGTLGKFVKDPSLYDNANQTIAKANRLMSDIEAGRGTIGKLAKDEQMAMKIDATVSKMNAIVTKIEAGQGTAGKLITDPSMFNNANSMMLETRNLIQAVREDPKKYLTIRFHLF